MTTELTPIKKLFEQENVQEKFKSILGQKTPGFILSVIDCVTNNEMLKEADRDSLLFAAANAAILDLPINANLGFAYIIPYKKKQTDGSYKTLAQFQIGYKGFIQLAQRSGQLKTVNVTPIYEGQLVEENPLDGYKFDFTKKDSKKIIGFAGKIVLLNGFEKVHYMTVQELQTHGKLFSQTYKKGYGLWESNFEAMAQKTVIKLLLSKYAPLSPEMQQALLTDQAVINDWDGKSLDYVDNETVKTDPEASAAVKEKDRIKAFIESCKNAEQLEDNCKEYCTTLEKDDEIKKLYEDKLDTLRQ